MSVVVYCLVVVFLFNALFATVNLFMCVCAPLPINTALPPFSGKLSSSCPQTWIRLSSTFPHFQFNHIGRRHDARRHRKRFSFHSVFVVYFHYIHIFYIRVYLYYISVYINCHNFAVVQYLNIYLTFSPPIFYLHFFVCLN